MKGTNQSQHTLPAVKYNSNTAGSTLELFGHLTSHHNQSVITAPYSLELLADSIEKKQDSTSIGLSSDFNPLKSKAMRRDGADLNDKFVIAAARIRDNSFGIYRNSSTVEKVRPLLNRGAPSNA